MSLRLKCLVVMMGLLIILPARSQPLELRLLVWEGYAPEAQRRQFQEFVREKYGEELRFSVKYIRQIEDIYRALRLKTADIISPSHNHINDQYFRFFDLGFVLPLDLSNIPNSGNFAEPFKHLPYLTYQGQAFGVPFAWGPYGLLYNADVIDSPPVSWDVLWQPQYQNRYTIANLSEHNIYITALALGYDEMALNDYDALDVPRFRGKLEQLVENSHHLWEGVDTALDLEKMALATSWGFSLPELKKAGNNWKWAPLEQKTPSWIDNLLISHTLKDKPQLKKIAEEWLNFVLSPEFQAEVVVRDLAARPVNQRARELLDDEELENIGVVNDNAYQTEFVLMPELERRTRNGFELLWSSALAGRRL